MMKKVLAVSSSGGHWQQLKLLMPAFNDQKLYFITTTKNRLDENDVGINCEHRLFKVIHANRKSKIKMAFMAVQMFILVLKIRPDIVISTGAAPGYFAIMFGKWFKAKTIWVDSMANYEHLSLSGNKSIKHCDLILTQWPHLQGIAKYWGSVL